MHLERLVPALLALALAVPAQAQDAERRAPRITDPQAAEEELPRPLPTKKRKHASKLEEDGEAPTEEAPSYSEQAPEPKKRKASSFGDDEAPVRRRSSRGGSAVEDSDLRDDDERRVPRTAEEELANSDQEDEVLAGVDEPGNGLAVELAGGPIFLSGATGSSTTHFFAGFIASYQLGRALFTPKWELLRQSFFLELSYLGANAAWGTEEVRVNAWNHFLTLDILFGWPLEPVLFYAKVGPALMVMPVSYDVQGSATSFTGVKGGLVYGAGIRTNLYLGEAAGFAARLELTRFRRGYLDDTLLTVGLGACF